MDLANKIDQLTQQFQTVTLEEIKLVSLMKRIDKKYVFNVSLLPSLLQEALPSYKLLKIEDTREQAYQTVYFDTNELNLYLDHHRGKLNRYKVRIRKYLSSGDLFLEVKHKNNKRQTIKERTDSLDDFQISTSHNQFIEDVTGIDIHQLTPQVDIRFKRITLINLAKEERITLDYNLSFQDPANEEYRRQLKNIAIAEVKRNAYRHNNGFARILHTNKIYASGFSKYCTGMILLNNQLKMNRFKQRLSLVQKIENETASIY